jgi:nicotinamidase-related amidase
MQLPPVERDPYIAWRKPLPAPEFAPENTALICIDMQYLDADWDSGICRTARDAGFEEDIYYYRDRLELIVPNIRKLQDACRDAGIDVIHTKIASLTDDGRDRGAGHKALGYHATPDSREAQILDEVKPMGDEIVLTKTNSSVFTGTMIDRILRNMGVRNLIFTGVVTTGCVETAVRDAADLGFACTVAEDACGAFVEEMHWASIRALRNVYSHVLTTEDVIERIRA